MGTLLFEPFNDYRYLYPPRPSYVISVNTLSNYDNGNYFAQAKLNGSCAVLFLDGKGNYKLTNRHNEPLTLFNPGIEFNKLHRGKGYMVLCGEYMNKNKKDARGKPFNHKFVIWDVLVYDSYFLKGATLVERMNLLNELYPCEEFKLTDEGIEYETYLCHTQVNDILLCC